MSINLNLKKKMTKEENTNYSNRCSIIKKLILKEFTNIKFEFKKNITTS